MKDNYTSEDLINNALYLFMKIDQATLEEISGSLIWAAKKIELLEKENETLKFLEKNNF